MFKYASANFYTGISETVVGVGVQRLFVAMLGLAWLFGCVAKRNRQCAKSVGSIATKSMTVKNGGNTIDAVEGLALWVSHCISRACGLAGGLQKIREERTPLIINYPGKKDTQAMSLLYLYIQNPVTSQSYQYLPLRE